MKNINNKKINIDPISEARKGKYFEQYSNEARGRIMLGVEIYNVREKMGISQQVLAKKAHTTQKVVSRVENGDVNIGFSLLSRIASVLNFNYENWGKIFGISFPHYFWFSGNATTEQACGNHEKFSLSKERSMNYFIK